MKNHNTAQHNTTHTDTHLSLTVSTCGTPGSDTQALDKAMAVRRVDIRENMPIGRARVVVEGRETAHLRRRFSFLLQHTLFKLTRHCLGRKGAMFMEAARLPT